MFDLQKQPDKKFAFDLEKKLKDHPHERQALVDKIDTRISELKAKLREGASEKEYDQLGILLHGYTALQKVLKKVK